jgi:hypothetical protein
MLFSIFLVYFVSSSIFLQEGESAAFFWEAIFFLGMMFVKQIILFLMVYFSLGGDLPVKKERVTPPSLLCGN